jgi:hypothetical protein
MFLPHHVGRRPEQSRASIVAPRAFTQNEEMPCGRWPKRPKDTMKNQSQHKPLKSDPAARIKSGQRKPAEAWRPRPTSLTREEVRDIVMEMIG